MIPQSFDEAFIRVKQLAEQFKQNEDFYLSGEYSEAQARIDFIDSFWIALGWDVNHDHQTNPYAQEVKVERAVHVSARRKRADYAFLAPNFRDVRFFVEAKKPQHDIDSADNYFQVIRYGWNSQTPLAVLTDFEQFRVVDCRYKPDIATASNRALRKFHFSQYGDLETFREIYYLFSREAVSNGSLETFAANLPKPERGAVQRALFATGAYQSIDEAFLAELDQYREELAQSFKKENSQLTGEDLTEATQRTLDRLVFIRFLEDKLIEPEMIVERLGDRGSAWSDFTAASQRLNTIYNGIIFKPHPIIDATGFKVDEGVFAGICEKLSDKQSPYDFNSIPIHILGSIYERFLGKVIVAKGKSAKIEVKPEVRKAGGVYYTPEYIVRYIIENTIGVLTRDKSPELVRRMRFADIACGSGSFLLGVYDHLLRHHTAFYNEKRHRSKGLKAGCIEYEDGTLHLSLKQKKDILLDNIFGVDLDRQAVEVAQLSLYLKLLDEETTSTRKQLELRETMLPSLDKNIVWGNSLVDWDIIDRPLLENDDDERKYNPLSFPREFPSAMTQGGFDAIVGNPPYGASLSARERQYLTHKFKAGTTDTAALMMLQAIRVAKKSSKVGLIVPKSLTYSSTWQETRNILLSRLTKLIDVGKVWREVKLEQSICIFDSQGSEVYESFKRQRTDFRYLANVFKVDCVQFGFYINGLSAQEIDLAKKLVAPREFLGDVVTNTRGGGLQAFLKPDPTGFEAIGGKQIQRNRLVGNKGFVARDTEIPINALIHRGGILIQNIVSHILSPKDHIKLIGALVPDSMVGNVVILDTVNQLTNKSDLSVHYLLALLHSRLINWFTYRFLYAKAIRTMHFDAPISNRIPIRFIDFASATDRVKHNRIVELNQALIEAQRRLDTSISERDSSFYLRKNRNLEAELDQLIYELFELTPNEIALVGDSF